MLEAVPELLSSRERRGDRGAMTSATTGVVPGGGHADQPIMWAKHLAGCGCGSGEHRGCRRSRERAAADEASSSRLEATRAREHRRSHRERRRAKYEGGRVRDGSKIDRIRRAVHRNEAVQRRARRDTRAEDSGQCPA